jgi:hypothetical protein
MTSFSGMFTKRFLTKVKKKAIRNKVWFKVLDNIERNILDLSIRLVDRVRSEVLGIVLVNIVKKIVDRLKSRYTTLVEEYGLQEAKRVSARAVEWGHEAARKWARDLNFARYLTLINPRVAGGWGGLV